MRKRKYLIITILLVGVLAMLTSCEPLTAEELAAKEEFKETAAQYYKEKYGVAPVIEDYGYDTRADLFVYRTEDLIAECADGTIIYYDTSKDLIVDNKQSESISDALEPVFYDRVEPIVENMQDGEIIVTDLDFSAEAGDYEDSFYHTYYDGDIEGFIQQEDIQLDAEIFLICEREDAWEDARKAFEQMLESDFRGYDSVELTVLSRDCYDKYQADIYRYPHTDMLECYAVYEMASGETASYIQHYIKAADGIYVTSYEKNFMLEEGDVTLVESDLSEEDLNRLIYENYDALPEEAEENEKGYNVPDKAHENYVVISADTPIYQIRFSNRVRERYAEELSVFLRCVPEELGLSADKKFYYYPNNGYPQYNCFSIYTDLADAEFTNLNEQDYYFVGSQEKQK